VTAYNRPRPQSDFAKEIDMKSCPRRPFNLLAVAVLFSMGLLVLTTRAEPKRRPAQELEGKPAPAFTLKGLDGQEVSLESQKGQVVVLDFWATWCGPCVASLPKLDEMAKQKASDGVRFYAINIQEEQDKVAKFVKEKGWSLPVLLDSDASVAQSYKAQAIPMTVVIGKDGVVKNVFIGFDPNGGEAQLSSAIDAANK
jgi:thiol-disulfide isomerase/thioredoxin